MKSHQRTVGKNDEWLTPIEILNRLGSFDLDPAAPCTRPWPTAARHISPPHDGLQLKWEGRIWLNPPFNRGVRHRWMQRMSEHGNGIMLVPAATETKAFYDYVWNAADAVCFLRGRPHFHYIDGSKAKANCGTAIALAAYGKRNVSALEDADLGVTIRLNEEDA